jgi:hypothetical protein
MLTSKVCPDRGRPLKALSRVDTVEPGICGIPEWVENHSQEESEVGKENCRSIGFLRISCRASWYR